MKKLLLTFSLLTCTLASVAQLQFRGLSPAAVINSYEFTYTSDTRYSGPWGADITVPGYELIGDLELVQDNSTSSDSLGCAPTGNDLTGKIAFVYRGGCTFYNKIYYAQQRGAIGVVVVNNVPGKPIGMAGGATASNVTIPAIQISKEDGAFLRSYMEQGPVEVILRDFQGYFGDNLSVLKDYALMPSAASIPALTAQNDTEFGVSLGAYIFNRGSNTATNATLKGQVYFGGSLVYEETSAPQTLNAADTGVFNLPAFTMTTYSLGEYEIVYSTNIENTVDEDPSGDTLNYSFYIDESIYSLVPLDDAGLPVANTYGTSGTTGLTSFTQCILYENANADRLAASGLYFSVDDTLSVDQEELNILAYKWFNEYDNALSPLSANFTALEEVSSTFFNIEGDLRETMIYAPFESDFSLESNQKYLFCINPTTRPRLMIGFNNSIDYTLNNFTFDEQIHPMRTFAGAASTEAWFSGFTSGIAPAIGVKTFDVSSLGISNTSEFKGSVFPNPTQEQLTISLETSEVVAQVNVVDVTGKTVMNKEINLVNGTSNLNVEHLENGMYIVRVSLNNGQSSIFNVVKK